MCAVRVRSDRCQNLNHALIYSNVIIEVIAMLMICYILYSLYERFYITQRITFSLWPIPRHCALPIQIILPLNYQVKWKSKFLHSEATKDAQRLKTWSNWKDQMKLRNLIVCNFCVNVTPPNIQSSFSSSYREGWGLHMNPASKSWKKKTSTSHRPSLKLTYKALNIFYLRMNEREQGILCQE